MDPWVDELDADPHVQFARWFADAVAAGITLPESTALATATTDGVPSARMVLLKGRGPDGYVFFSNLESRKGGDLAANPRAALVLYWQLLDRQVRVEGDVELIGDEVSAAYFASRPRGSRVGAWSSPQSRPVADRDELERRFVETERRYPTDDVPLPPFWGGYRVVAVAMEFWQGRADRLHDRARYQREGDRWRRFRLAP